MDNYFIKEKNANNYFCGWNNFGEIVFKKDPKYIYRMKRTVAERNLYKMENFLHRDCEVYKTSA